MPNLQDRHGLRRMLDTTKAVAAGIKEIVQTLGATQPAGGRLVALREEAARDDPFIESAGAWFDRLPARSTLEYREGNSRA